MSSVNKQIILGRVGKDPEVRTLDSGVSVAKVTIATDYTWKTKSGEKQSKTTWHNVVFWRGQAEVIEKYVKKGQLLYVEGRTETRSYDDKEGNKRYITEVTATDFQFIGGSKNENQQPEEKPDISTSSIKTETEEDDSLPF